MIRAVPSHDRRDFEFAKKYNIPIKVVIDKNSNLINSGKFNGENKGDVSIFF